MIVLESGTGNYVHINNKRYSYFAGNNYLGLANHPYVRKAAIKSIEKFGLNFSASRHTTGTSVVHLELEKLLSEFKNKQDAVIFASGYLGNKILLHALKNNFSAIYMDEASHPSIADGIPGDTKRVHCFEHCNAGHLEHLLQHNRNHNPLIITDGIFALTGEIAPLDQIYPLAEKYNAILVVDDAHSTGILGEHGRGTPEHFHLEEAPNIFQTESMSKALGVYGGYIADSTHLINSIRENSLVYMATTSLPPPVVSAVCASIKIIREQPELRKRLLDIATEIRTRIIRLDFQTTKDNTPIIPVMLPTLAKARDLSAFLEDNNIIVPFMNYPVKQAKYIVRITVSVSHTIDQTEVLLEMLKKWKEKNGTD